MKEKIIKMVEIEVEMDEHVLERMIEVARSRIVNDRQALINYGVNLALKEI